MAFSNTSGWYSYGIGWPVSAGGGGATSPLRVMLEGTVVIDPEDTPAWSMLPKEDVNQVQYSWLIDALATPDGTSAAAQPEGFDFAADTPSTRTGYSNVCEIRAKGVKVSRTLQTVTRKGGAVDTRDEYAYQLAKKMKEVTRDMDAAFWITGQANYASSTAVATTTGGPSNTRITAKLRAYPIVTSSVGGTFATDSYSALREDLDTRGANIDSLWVSSGVKADVSNLLLRPVGATSVNNSMLRFTQDIAKKEFSAVIDVLEDDFGRVYIIRDRWMPQASATAASASSPAYFLMDRSKVKWTILDNIQHVPLPPTGDHTRGMIVVEWGTKVLHPSAVGMGYNVIT